VASASEIDWWELTQPHILRYVKNGKIWVDPESGQPLKVCPWLEKSADSSRYSCKIYLDRPDDCKHYPVDIAQMTKDDCEMLEASDLKDPIKAQRRLDLIMSDSRPGGIAF